MAIETIDLVKEMSEKIKIRYLDLRPEDSNLGNIVADTFFPNLVRRSMRRMRTNIRWGKRTYAISQFIAKEINATVVPFEDIAAMLGYRKKDIKEILDAVKSKGYVLNLMGFGGTGTNFFHWLKEMCELTNTVNVFERINVYDDDKIDLTNVFRFPFDLNIGSVYENSGTNNGILKVKLASRGHIASTNQVYTSSDRFDPSALTTDDFDPEVNIFYGAPDIHTREMFSNLENKVKFISGTHGDSECQLYINPPQDSNLQVESYGMINLSVFFMNQAKMSIEFMRLLGSDEDLIDPREVMSYDFQKEYLAGNISRTGVSRTYNFPIVENVVVADNMNDDSSTEEQNNDN